MSCLLFNITCQMFHWVLGGVHDAQSLVKVATDLFLTFYDIFFVLNMHERRV
jgi:hypothetical protein